MAKKKNRKTKTTISSKIGKDGKATLEVKVDGKVYRTLEEIEAIPKHPLEDKIRAELKKRYPDMCKDL